MASEDETETFNKWLDELPPAVKTYLKDAGFSDKAAVADSVSPELLNGTDGKVVEKAVDIVFVESVAANVEIVRRGTPAWAKCLQFFRRCYHVQDEPAVSDEAGPVEAKDVQAEEYYELSPEYRRKRLDALNAVSIHLHQTAIDWLDFEARVMS